MEADAQVLNDGAPERLWIADRNVMQQGQVFGMVTRPSSLPFG
jgi:hypothetical protein